MPPCLQSLMEAFEDILGGVLDMSKLLSYLPNCLLQYLFKSVNVSLVFRHECRSGLDKVLLENATIYLFLGLLCPFREFPNPTLARILSDFCLSFSFSYLDLLPQSSLGPR